MNERWHTPVKAVLFSALGGEVFLFFLTYGVTSSYAFLLYSYAGLATIAFAFTFMAISAIVFPYRRKDLYESASPIKRKILGVPLITWLGIVSLAYVIGTVGYYSYAYQFYFGTGSLAANSWFPFLGTLAAIFAACIVWFYVVKRLRTKEGIPFEMAYREIPPE
jgi:hypothetical protein